jgi:hypothetical protein
MHGDHVTQHVRPGRARLRRIVGTVLIPVLGIGAVAAGGPTAFAAPVADTVSAAAAGTSATPDPWAASVPLTDGTASHSLVDVTTARNGAVVALWHRGHRDRAGLELMVSVRPASSATWGAPHTLAATPGRRGEAVLVPSPDGSVTAAWMEFPNDSGYTANPGGVFRMSVLAPGASSWSAPSQIMSSPDRVHEGKLAGSPNGTLVATWTRVSAGRVELHSSVRPAPGQAGAAPARLDRPADGEGFSGHAQLVQSEQGTATVAFVEGGPETSVIKIVDRTPGGTWSAPVSVSATDTYASNPLLKLGKDGRAVLLWQAQDSTADGGTSEVIAQRPAGSPTWGAAEPANGFEGGTWRKMAVGPEGDITLLGVAWTEGLGYAARTTTRSAATGTWSEPRTISTGYVPDDQFDLTAGPDGSVHAVWTQGDTDRKLMASSRVGSVWSATPTPLSTNTTGYALGRVTVDAALRPVAVWQQSTGDFTTQVRAASTAPAVAPRPAWHDVTGDGKGDLLGLTPGGTLAVRPGTGTGTVGTGPSATGWASSSLLVPFGDLTGDGCGDLLVRNAAGALTRYDGGCGTAFSPNGKRAGLGSGWQIYNHLSAPGDLTGDGRTDLLARTSAGELWMYADNGAGAFKPRIRVGTGWQIYDTVVAAGDLNGDKAGDLLARDSAGALWRYYGTGRGTFGPRVRIGTGWQTYNAVVGVGDLNADGKADLVARDAAGALWRYNGTGAGTLSARVRIGTGWQMYARLA